MMPISNINKTVQYCFPVLTLCITLALINSGCNPNNPTPTNNTVQTSWEITVDNKTYYWTDNYTLQFAGSSAGGWYPEHINSNPGVCEWVNSGNSGMGEISLHTNNLPGFTEDNLTCIIGFTPANTGTWTITQNSWQTGVLNPCTFSLEISDYPLVNNIGTISWNMMPHNITLNISEFATNKGGLVKGNFSGNYTDMNNVVHTVSGLFKAIRVD